jgi:predicted ATP-binding protein involved in virulence
MSKTNHKKSRSIREVTNNARKGNLFSMFQLYENYSTGQYVGEPNDKLASKYLDQISEKLLQTKLKINRLKIKEFKRYRELDIDFDDNFTVIVGDNGAGKTSIVEAITICLSNINNNLLRSKVSGKKIKDIEINVNATDYAELDCQFSLDKKNDIELILFTPTAGYSGKSTTHIESVKDLGEIYRKINENCNVTIPLLASYPVERSSSKMATISLEKGFYRNSTSRFNAIRDSLASGAIAEGFVNTYIELTNLAEGEETQEIKEARQSIRVLEDLIARAKTNNKEIVRNELTKELGVELKGLDSLLNEKPLKHQESLKQVNRVIQTIIPQVIELRVDRSKGKSRFLLSFTDHEVEFNQLSQGQKTLMALTGDLALRLITLNPHLDNPLAAQGIVVIDELDLHLHPKWQQSVPLTLQNAFPNIQFIVTTHSPQALSTIDYKCIRRIIHGDKGQVRLEVPDLQTKGVRSSDVLEQIMETFSVPPVKEAKWLTDYLSLVAQNKWDTEDGRVLYQSIIEHFGEVHPEVQKIQGDIRVQSLKNRAKKLKDKG